MTFPDEIVRREVYEGWKGFLDSLETALDSLEKEVTNTSKMLDACTLEWHFPLSSNARSGRAN